MYLFIVLSNDPQEQQKHRVVLPQTESMNGNQLELISLTKLLHLPELTQEMKGNYLVFNPSTGKCSGNNGN